MVEQQEKKGLFARGRDFLGKLKQDEGLKKVGDMAVDFLLPGFKQQKQIVDNNIGKLGKFGLNVLKKTSEVDRNIKEQNERIENEQQVKQTSQENVFQNVFQQQFEEKLSTDEEFKLNFQEVNQLQSEINELEEQKQQYPVHSNEFANIDSFIRKKKNDLATKQQVFDKAIQELSVDVDKRQSEMMEKNPYRYFFTNNDNAEQFINEVITPFEFNEQGERIIDTPQGADAIRASKQALGAFTNSMDDVVSDMVKVGMLNTSDDFWLSDEWENFSRDTMSIVNDMVINNYDTIFKNGQVDEKMFRSILYSNEDFKQLEKQFSNMKRDYRQEYKNSMVREELQGLPERLKNITSNLYTAPMLAGPELVSTLWNASAYTLSAYMSDKLRDPQEFLEENRFGGPSQGVREDIINQYIPGEDSGREILDDLFGTFGEYPIESAINVIGLVASWRNMARNTSGRAPVTDIVNYPRLVIISEKIPAVRHATKVMDMGKGALREIKGSLLFDFWIDTITGEPQPLMNTAINTVIGGLTHLPGAGGALKIADRIFFSKEGERIAKLKDLGINATKSEIQSLEKTRELVNAKIESLIDDKDALKGFMIKEVSKGLEDVNVTDPVAYYESMVNVFKDLGGESPLGNSLGKIESLVIQMKEGGNVEKLSNQAKKELINVAENLSADGYQKLFNVTVREDGISNLANTLHANFKSFGLSDEAAIIATAKSISGLDEPVDIISYLRGGFPEDAAKLEGNMGKFSSMLSVTEKTKELLSNPLKNLSIVKNAKAIADKNIDKFGELYNAALSSKKAQSVGGVRSIDEAGLENYTLTGQQQLRNQVGGIYNSVSDADSIGKEGFGQSFMKSVNGFIDKGRDGLSDKSKKLFNRTVEKIVQDTGIDSFDGLVGKLDITNMNISELTEAVYKNAMRNILFNGDSAANEFASKLSSMGMQNIVKNIQPMKGPIDDILELGILENKGFVAGLDVSDLKNFANVDSDSRRFIDRIDNIVDVIDEGQYIKMLRSGLTIGGRKLVQSVYEVANKIRKSMKDGSIPDIDAAYFSPQGKLLLDSIFEGTDFKDIYIKAYNLQKNRINNNISMLEMFYDGQSTLSNGVTAGGKTFSLASVLRRIPLRFSQGIDIVGREAGAFYPALVLTKYLAASEEGGRVFLEQYARVLNSVTSGTAQDIGMSFAAKVGKEGFGESIVQLHEDVSNYLRKELGLGEDFINDWAHSILYNPLEYAFSVSNISSYDDLVQEVSRALAYRNRGTLYNIADNDSLLKTVDGFLRKTPRNQSASWKTVPYNIKNSYNALLEEGMLKAIDNGDVTMTIGKNAYDEFVYKIAGYFTSMRNAGLANSKNNAYLSTVYNYLGKLDDKQDAKIIDMITDLTRIDEKTGRYSNVSAKIEDFKKYIKSIEKDKTKLSNIDEVLDTFENYTKELDDKSISQSLVDDMYNGIRESKEKTKQSMRSVPDEMTPETLLEKADVDDRFNEFSKKLEQESLNRIMRDKESRLALANGNADSIMQIMGEAGMSRKEMETVLDSLGFSEKTINNILEEGGKTKVIKEDIPKVITRLISDGSVGFYEAMRKNKVFREYVNNILLKDIGTLNGNKWFSVSKFGDVKTHTDVAFDGFTKYFTSLNTKAFLDAETNQIVQEFLVARGKKLEEYSFRYGDLKGYKSVSSDFYTTNVRSIISKFISDNKLGKDNFVEMITPAFDGVKNNSDFTKLAEKYSGKEKELFEMLWDYFSDIKKLRGGLFADSTRFLEGVGTVVPSHEVWNILNRITGGWTNLSQDAMETLGKKMREGGGKLNSLFGNIKRNVLYGAVFDKSIFGNVSRGAARMILAAWFGPQQIGKFFQQTINQEFLGESLLKQLSYDGNKLSELQKFVDLQYDVKAASRQTLILPGEAGIPGLDTIMENLNVMVWADNVTKKTAMKSALVDSLYDIQDALGIEGVTKFLDEVGELSDFMSRYGLDKYDMYNKNLILAKVGNGKVPSTADAELATKMHNFFMKDYNKFQKNARTSLHMFYVQDGIAELGFTPITDTYRWLFPLRRWAIGKSSEYASRIFKEYNKKGKGRFISDVISGQSEVFNRFVAELAQTYKLGWGLEKLTGGEVDRGTSILFLSVGVSAFMMTMGDAVVQFLREGTTTYGLLSTAGKSEAESILGAFAWSTVTLLSELKSTNFLYETAILGNVVKSYNTAQKLQGDDQAYQRAIGGFFENMFLSTLKNSFSQNYGGFRSLTDTDGSVTTNLAEFLLNARGKQKRQRINEMNASYMALNMQDGYWKALGNHFLSSVIGQGKIQRGSAADLGILFESVSEFQNTKKLGLLTDKFAYSRDEDRMNEIVDEFTYFNLLEKIEDKATSDDSLDKDIRKAIIDLKAQYGNDLKDAPIEDILNLGYIITNTNHPMLDMVKGTLRGQNSIGSSMEDFIRNADMGDNASEVLVSEFMNMFDEIEKEGKSFTDTQVRKFIMAQSEVGTNYIMSDYIAAMQVAIRQHLGETMGVGDRRDPEKQQVSAMMNMSPDERERYNQYVETAYLYQEEVLKAIRPSVGDNKFVGQQLMMEYLKNSPESPVKTLSARETAMLRANWFRDAVQDEGYVSQEALNPFYIMKTQIAERARLLSSEDPEKAMATAKFLFKALENEVDVILSTTESPIEQQQGLMALMWSYSDMMGEFQTMLPNEFSDFIERTEIGDSITDVINVLTDAAPTDKELAYEYATGTNLNPGSKVKKLNLSTRQEKPKEFAIAHNKFVDFALKLGKTGKFEITPIKYKIIPGNTKSSLVSIKQVNVDIPEPPKPKTQQVRGRSARTRDLRVADTRGKTGVKFSGRFRPKSIKFTKESS